MKLENMKNLYLSQKHIITFATIALLSYRGDALAQHSVDDLSKAAANPLSPVISLPITHDFDFGGDRSGNGFSYLTQAEPVIPLQLNEQWNVIARIITPFAFNDRIPGHPAGLGDITTSFFLSPTTSGPGGLIWGVGPALLLPTATNSRLGGGKWGAGPTAVVLLQESTWTVGALVSHIWSFAGPESRSDVSVSQFEPFVAYDFGGGRSLSLTIESTYDWRASQWTVPVNLVASQVFTVGSQAMSLAIGGRYYAEAPEGGPKWGLRTSLTLFFPEK
jgi:hypothetical protein